MLDVSSISEEHQELKKPDLTIGSVSDEYLSSFRG